MKLIVSVLGFLFDLSVVAQKMNGLKIEQSGVAICFAGVFLLVMVSFELFLSFFSEELPY